MNEVKNGKIAMGDTQGKMVSRHIVRIASSEA
jgi:hypothetical protein